MADYNSVGAGATPSAGSTKFINGPTRPSAAIGGGQSDGPAMGKAELGKAARPAPIPPAPSMGVLPPEVPGRAMRD